jgi:hypothetical protein
MCILRLDVTSWASKSSFIANTYPDLITHYVLYSMLPLCPRSSRLACSYSEHTKFFYVQLFFQPDVFLLQIQFVERLL